MKPWQPLPLLLALMPALASPVSADTSLGVEAAQPRRSWAPCGTAAVRLADIYPGPTGSEPRDLVHGEGVLFFTADDGAHGRELWRSSGTAGPGTSLVEDVFPGTSGSDPRDLTRVGDRLFFSADDGVNGRELWVSDGTAAGTYMVKDIRAGADSAIDPFPSLRRDERRFLELDGVLYFGANDGVHGAELWRSDGTAAGTYMVEELEPGGGGSHPRRFARVGDAFYFVGSRGFDVHLFRSTGTPGAVSVLERVEDNFIFNLTPLRSRLFFLIDNDEGEASLWKTDGTAASTRHLRFFHGEYPHDLVALGNRLVFSAGANFNGGGFGGEPEGEELWVSSGTVAGTQLLEDLRAGPDSSSPGALATMEGRVFFGADDGTGAGRELWVTDGTPAGTVLFKDLEAGAGSSSPEALTAIHGTLFFSANTAGRGRELWVSDGTPTGTLALDELAPGAASSSPRDFLRSGWDVFFTAEDGAGRELWALPFRPAGECLRSR
jgi:ELWxxDGT repeat protein